MQEADLPDITVYRNGRTGSEELCQERPCELLGRGDIGTALSRVINTPKPMSTDIQLYGVDVPEVRRIIDRLPGSGYLNPEEVRTLLRAANIPLVEEYASDDRDALLAFARR